MKKIIIFLFSFVTLISAQGIKKNNVENEIKKAQTTTYDFTNSSDKYYGTNGAKEIQEGVWGMIAGDVNTSGIITNSDKDQINTELNSSGYFSSDVNLSGIVTNSDKDMINANINKSTQVP